MFCLGTATLTNALADLDSVQVDFPIWEQWPCAAKKLQDSVVIAHRSPVRVHRGFNDLNEVLQQTRGSMVNADIERFAEEHMGEGREVVFSGHSLGGMHQGAQ